MRTKQQPPSGHVHGHEHTDVQEHVHHTHAHARPAPRRPEAPSKRVILYTKTDCADCFNAKRYLTNRKVDFEVRDIYEEGRLDELLDLLGPGSFATPIIVAGDHVFSGFSQVREHLDHVLTRMGY